MNEPLTLSVTRLECIRDTSEFDSDEPYILVFSADVTRPDFANINPVDPDAITDALSNSLPTAATVLYGPWDDVDPGEVRHTMVGPPGMPLVIPRTPFWGVGGNARPIPDAGDVLFLVAVMEHDEGNPAAIRQVAHAATFSALVSLFPAYIRGELTRAELGQRMRQNFRDSLGFPATVGIDVEVIFPGVGVFPSSDDLVNAFELVLTNDVVARACADGVFSDLNMELAGDGGRYKVHFEVRRDETAQVGQELKIGTTLHSSPAVISRQLGALDVFGRGDDRRIYISSWNGSKWSAWSPIGNGTFTSGPAAALRRTQRGNNGQLFVVARGDDRRLYESIWTGASWTNWGPVNNGTFISGPSIAASRQPRVFATGDDRRVYFATLAGNRWSAWTPIGIGTFRSAPSAVAWGRGALDVFAIGDDRGMYQSSLNGSNWSGWKRVGNGTFRSAPAAVTWGGTHLTVFSVGDDTRMYQATQTPTGWSDWSVIDPKARFSSGPSAFSAQSNRLDLVALGNDRRIYHNAWLGNAWSGWMKDTPEGSFK